MRTLSRFLIAAPALGLLCGAFLIYGFHPGNASDHQDSPLMVQRPGADISDVFVFPAADPNNVVLAMDVHPLIPTGQAGTVSFDPGVMYQLKISTDGSGVENKVIQFKAEGAGSAQKIAVYGPAAPGAAGTRSSWLENPQNATFGEPADLAGGMKVFAGPREDPFYFDLAQFFKIVPDRNWKNHPRVPPPTASCFRKDAHDFLLGFNVLSFVIELPRTMLAGADGKTGKIGVWATTSLPVGSGGAYTQVERLGRPAVKEAFQAFARHDATNRSAPTNDPALAADIYRFMTAKAPNGAGRSEAVAKAAVKVLIPDEIQADLSEKGPARYLAVETNGKSGLPTGIVRAVPPAGIEGIKKSLGDPYRKFGGRDLNSPVIDLSLGSIFGSLLPKLGLAPDDHHETPCLTSDNTTPAGKHFTATFPYIGTPR